MTTPLTNEFVLSCYEGKELLAQASEKLKKKLADTERELEEVELNLSYGLDVAEIYEGVPLEVYPFMGTTYGTISQETTRYGRVSKTVRGTFHAHIGDDRMGGRGERIVAWYLEDEDEAAKIVKDWIVTGKVPKER